jgi:hypothetical protein
MKQDYSSSSAPKYTVHGAACPRFVCRSSKTIEF